MAEEAKFEDLVSDSLQRNGGQPVCKNDFQMLSVIGKGSYGKVLLVRKKACGELYAIKVLKKSDLQRRNQVERTMTERRILGQVRHPFVVKMDYAFTSATKLFFVLEYCPGGELFYYLSKIGRFKEEAARFYASNVLLALEHLHTLNVLYRE
jgi:serine/threonine protein kinase